MTMFGSQWFAAPSAAAYEIDNSLCLNSPDSPYLSKTFSSAGNRKTWTFSCWLKLSRMLTGDGNYGGLFRQGNHYIGFRKTAALGRTHVNVSGVWSGFGGAALKHLHRDPSAWYHYVLTWDTTEGTAADRIKIYVNNTLLTLVTEGGTLPSEDYDGVWMNNAAHELFRASTSDAYIFDGYAAELVVCDGTAYTPSSFAETNDQGVWVPKKISGLSFGTNGFHLDFKDSSSLGNDVSGNNNDWTANNLAAADQSTDTPTNNFCTVNPIYRGSNATASAYGATTFGNLGLQYSGSADGGQLCTMIFPTGKFYWEIRVVAGGNSSSYDLGGGIADAGGSYTKGTERMRGIATGEIGFNSYNGEVRFSNSVTKTYSEAPFVNGDIIGVAADATNGAIYYSKNGTFMGSGSPTSGASKTNAGATWTASSYTGWVPTGNVSGGSTPVQMFNFGQNGTFAGAITAGGNSDGNGVGDFKYSVPSGYLALCSNNLAAPALKDPSTNFQTALFTGTGSSRSVTNDGNSDMQPDIIWIGGRSNAYNKGVFDAARGVQKELQLSATATETTLTAGISAFDSDGFSFNGTNYNTNTYTFVAWQWAAGNSGSSNTAGDINTTTTYVDTTAGISVSTFEGNGTAGQTVGHGLGVKPDVIIIKNRDNTEQWIVYHTAQGATKYGLFNSDASFSSSTSAWNDVEPTTTLVTLGGGGFGTNVSGDSMLMYAFAEVAGFSSFGSYVGNGNADAPFAYTGFRPAMIIVKPATRTDNWIIWDNKRDTSNLTAQYLTLDTTNIEYTGTVRILDITGNGFKIKSSHNSVNNSGDTYVYMAFAENPFGGDGVAPATAR